MNHFRNLALAVSLTLIAPLAFATTVTGTFKTGPDYSGDITSGNGGNINFTLNGQSKSAGGGNFSGSSFVSGQTTTNFSEVFCVDLYDTISTNSSYTSASYQTGTTTPTVGGAAVTNDGLIAALLVDTAVSTSNTYQNEALQAAIWTEEYSGFTLSSNNNSTMIQDYCQDLASVGTTPPSALCSGYSFTIKAAPSSSVQNADIAELDWITPGNWVQGEVGVPPTVPTGQSTGVTPEPGSLVLLGTGLLGVAGAARRRFKA